MLRNAKGTGAPVLRNVRGHVGSSFSKLFRSFTHMDAHKSNSNQSLPLLPTIGTIAMRNRVPTHRVLYAIRALGIVAAHRAGNARVFDEAQVQLIENELSRIAEARRGVAALSA